MISMHEHCVVRMMRGKNVQQACLGACIICEDAVHLSASAFGFSNLPCRSHSVIPVPLLPGQNFIPPRLLGNGRATKQGVFPVQRREAH